MHNKKLQRLSLSALFAIICALIPLHPWAASAASGPTAIGHFFSETNQALTGVFWRYWLNHGNLAQQGYPISPELLETSSTDGNDYVVQYTERAVFEYHPENAAPNDVLLALLGVFRYNERYPNGALGQTPNKSAGAVLFNETGHWLGGDFLAYWRANGGLAQQGYPISDEFTEKSDLDGKTYTVQYFERAVFEKHPENRPPYNVLLSQLGTFRFAQLYQSTANPNSSDSDNDGITNDRDSCPNTPENINKVFDLDGCPDTMQTLLVFAAEDINSFWQSAFDASNINYFPPEDFVAYTGPIETGCGPAIPDNAFYCGRSHGIYYHYPFLLDQLNTDGDFAPITILAHEWGHLVQAQLGLLDGSLYTIQTELQADCFAGAWAAHAGDEGLLEEGDLDEGAVALFRAGDDLDTPWFDPNAHGQPDERVSAFELGLTDGITGCLDQ